MWSLVFGVWGVGLGGWGWWGVGVGYIQVDSIQGNSVTD